MKQKRAKPKMPGCLLLEFEPCQFYGEPDGFGAALCIRLHLKELHEDGTPRNGIGTAFDSLLFRSFVYARDGDNERGEWTLAVDSLHVDADELARIAAMAARLVRMTDKAGARDGYLTTAARAACIARALNVPILEYREKRHSSSYSDCQYTVWRPNEIAARIARIAQDHAKEHASTVRKTDAA